MEIILQGKLYYIPLGPPKDHNSEDMVDDNQDRESVSETFSSLEDNSTSLISIVRTKK